MKILRILKKFWQRQVMLAEKYDREVAERKQMYRDNIKAWNELHKDFIKEMDREVDREVDELSDISKPNSGNGYNYYDFS